MNATAAQPRALPKSIKPTQAPNDNERIIRRGELAALTGLSVSTIYSRMDPESETYDPDFPPRVKLGTRNVGWRLGDVRRWTAGLARVDGKIPTAHDL